jgi:signal transduction histidine kinase
LVAESTGQGGQLSLDLQPLDLSELARAASERFKARYAEPPLRLEIEPVDALHGDPARLTQILDNLLDNAAKYSPAEQEVVLRVRMQDATILLGVQDRGVGIASEHLPHLFDRFYRVPGSATARVKGLGLGLFIVRDLVVAHGGRVWAESEGPGRGSTFWVSLPAVRAAVADPEPG